MAGHMTLMMRLADQCRMEYDTMIVNTVHVETFPEVEIDKVVERFRVPRDKEHYVFEDWEVL